MKKTRFAAAAASLTLALAMSMSTITASATIPELDDGDRPYDGTVGRIDQTPVKSNITVPATGHTYSYYQIFTGRWYEEASDTQASHNKNDIGKGIYLSDAKWGADLDSAGLLKYIKANHSTELQQIYLQRAINNKVVPAATTVAGLEAAFKSGVPGTNAQKNAAWAASDYNVANFGTRTGDEVKRDIEDVLDLFKEWQKDTTVAAAPTVAGNYKADGSNWAIGQNAGKSTGFENVTNDPTNQNVLPEATDYDNNNVSKPNDEADNHRQQITNGNKKIVNLLASFAKGNGTAITTKYNEETSVSVNNGYYLLLEHDEGWDGQGRDQEHAFKEATLMKIVDQNIRILPKLGTPTLEKKIFENYQNVVSVGKDLAGGYKNLFGKAPILANGDAIVTDGSKWNDAADYSIGDMVPFALFGTVPENIQDYEHFFYQFKDRLGKGFKIPAAKADDAINGITIVCGTLDPNPNPETDNGKDNAKNRELKNVVDITDKFTIVKTAQATGETVMTYTCNDLIAAIGRANINKNTVVRVRYNAEMDTDAVIGRPGNTNGASLVYSSDVNYDGTGFSDVTTNSGNDDKEHTTKGNKKSKLSETKEDGVAAFTYEIDVNKVDGVDLTKKLKDAQFVVKATSGEHKGQYVIVSKEGTDKDRVIGWSNLGPNDTGWSQDILMKTDDSGMIKIAGLDDGTYEITEVKAPRGYNSLRDPLNITIDSTLENQSGYVYSYGDPDNAANELISLATGTNEEEKMATTDADKGTYDITILNNKGIVLPQTGGVGTVMLYVCGGIMLLTGGTYFMTRKKKTNKN